MSDKIKPHHLASKAILYVRQSSTHQVLHSRESQVLQYAMRDRLVALGWSEVDTVDDDLGRSAAGGVTRVGFERMVAEVCLGRRVARRISFTTCSGGSFSGPDFCLIFAPSMATMSQKSSRPQPNQSVSRTLMPDNRDLMSA